MVGQRLNRKRDLFISLFTGWPINTTGAQDCRKEWPSVDERNDVERPLLT